MPARGELGNSAYTINYDDLANERKLPDGDTIQLSYIDGANPERVVFILELQDGLNWWKGILSNEISLCSCYDAIRSGSGNIEYNTVMTKGIQLWKAKQFGIHLNIYDVTDVKNWIVPGRMYTFLWKQD